ncbi:MAG: 50S ribosomal protein L11 methyltransferase, partial [Bacteroidia bacterium]|nr:50S ribosomal protein L11 methyltransferase [Bacteroidia bacterium]
MDYTLLEIKIKPLDPFRDLLSYRLAACGFDMFEDTAEGLKAYAPSEAYRRDDVKGILKESEGLGCSLESREEIIPWKNWNEEWEKQYQPEIIGGKIYVRAEFHPPNPGFPLEI